MPAASVHGSAGDEPTWPSIRHSNVIGCYDSGLRRIGVQPPGQPCPAGPAPGATSGTISVPVGSPTIIIVSYNSGAHLEHCLESAAAHAPNAPVIVVDNASADGSGEVAARFPRATLIRNASNVGFGAAVNQGAKAARDAALLLLNPDCELTAGSVDALELELAAHPDCAVAAPTVLNSDGSVQGSVRGDPTMMTGLFGRTSLLTRLLPQAPAARRNVQSGALPGDASRTADWVSGACMLVRRDAFDAVAGFDERYFLYWEDADLCRRMRQRGYTIRYVPRARVIHAVGVSSRTAKALSIRAFHQSAFLYYRTHVARTAATRAFAWLMLEARCRWKLAVARRADR
jgi:GT2 family glycosyltransferase